MTTWTNDDMDQQRGLYDRKIGADNVHKANNDNDDEPKIPLQIRALPLIDLLKNAIKNQNNVMWS